MSIDILKKLMAACDEEQVEKIIKADAILLNDKNWKPYGGFRGNFSQIHNQQGNTIPALVEKPINSIDALLLKQCKIKGIDPEGKDAPKSIKEAVELFFGVKNGDFSEVDEEKRRQIAESIQIIAVGNRSKPTICIYDDGEGQHPSKFEDTFLSLNKDNKLKIKFVQGKYNMGSTGAIPNCGQKKYQLILSRKHQKLLNGQKDLYGFTLVRLHKVVGNEEYKNSWYEYCVDEAGNIFSFAAESLDAGLLNNKKFISGTFIKLFNYDLPRSSDITLDLWRDLNRYLYFPGLPILVYEKRDFKGHSSSKLMLGNRLRIMIDERELKQTTFPIEISTNGIKCSGEVTVFNSEVDKGEFIDKLAVVFTVNGQVHDHLPNSFITSGAKLPYLSGSILVNLDCSNIPTNIREEMFMSSRDRMRDNTLTRKLKEDLAKELRDNEYLRNLNEKRRDEKIYKNPKDEEFMKKIMGKLLNQNEDIAKILGLKGDIQNKIKRELKGNNKNGVPDFKGERFPSYLKFKNIEKGNIKCLPQNGECKLLIETDVEDEYLLRSTDPGQLQIKFEKSVIRIGPGPITPEEASDEEVFDVNITGPNQGEIKIRLKTKKELPVGSIQKVDIKLLSAGGPIEITAFVQIVNPQNQENKAEAKSKQSYNLPKMIEVYREKKIVDSNVAIWQEYNWDGEDICKIFPSGDKDHLVDAIAINMDAEVIHNYMRQKKLTDKNVEHLKRLYKVAVFLVSLILYFQIEKKDAKEIEDKEEMTSFLMKGIGKILLQVVVNDEILKEIEKDDLC